ncbi:MAG: peptide chain release factor-like protein [bacterium]|nr:peptide chain release factor-like protein [bacterium]
MDFPIELPNAVIAMASTLHISPEDISETFTKGSGHGGQKVNKTSSCVELYHAKTRTTVRVQKHREQSKNRISAYKLLILKIEEKKKGKESKRALQMHKVRKQKQRRSRKSKEKMLEEKHHHAEIKDMRKKIV